MSVVSIGGPEPRSPSTLKLPHAARSLPIDNNNLTVKTRFTDFFIDTILGPEFGGARRPSRPHSNGHHQHHHHSHHHHHHHHSNHHRSDDDSDVAKQEMESISKSGAENRPLSGGEDAASQNGSQWPAWVYCTRYSDRPSSGPRIRKVKRREKTKDEKRPRTAFSASQLQRLKQEFQQSNYLTEQRRRNLAKELSLSESQIKIWFQNKRAKIKKASGLKNDLAMQLMAQGLYNHSTVALEAEKRFKAQNASGDCSRSDYTSDSDGESLTH